MTQQAIKEFDSLDEELEVLITLLRPFSHEQLNRPAANGGWSAMQCLHHLMLAELSSQQYVQKKLSFNPELKNYSAMKEWGRKMLIKGYMKTPIKVAAPKFLTGDFLPLESDFNEVVSAWQAQRNNLRSLLGSLDESLFRKALMKHPLAGRISLTTMLVFFRAHLQRHQRQALRVLNK